MIDFILGSVVTLVSVIFGSAITFAIESNSKKEVAKNVKGKTLSS